MAQGQNPYIYGLHDSGGENLLMHHGEPRGWVLVTEAIRDTPHETRGTFHDYRRITNSGLGLIVRLNFDYGPEGTIPTEDRYDNFARRAANFVRSSPGAHIWIIGNEMNLEREQPRRPGSTQAEVITPRRYAECYKKVRNAIRSLPGHADDLIVVGAIGPWNAQTAYDADPQGQYPANKIPGGPNEYPYFGFWGDFIQYGRDLLLAIGRDQCDGIGIHTYSHGYAPELVFSERKMGPPFTQYYFDFYSYRDQMNAIPAAFRDLPVFLTEMNGDANPDGGKWPDVNSGWVKNAYEEINNWNRRGGQQIRCAMLYRWIDHDDWSIMHKGQVHADLRDAVSRGYRWDPTAKPQPIPVVETPTSDPESEPPLETPPILVPTVTRLQIEDIAAELPADAAAGAFATRALSAIERIVMHHTATPADTSAESLAQHAIERQGQPGLPYHFLITVDGRALQTQALTAVARHAGHHSHDSVGVALVGNFDRAAPPNAQLGAAAALLNYLAQTLNLDSQAIEPYSALVPSTSPGRTWAAWGQPLLRKVRGYLMSGLQTVTDAAAASEPEAAPEPQSFRARVVDQQTPQVLEAGVEIQVSLTLQNTGSSTWPDSGDLAGRLCFTWFNALGQRVRLSRDRVQCTALPRPVGAGDTVKVLATLSAPNAAGVYRLVWQMQSRHGEAFAETADAAVSGIRIAPIQRTQPTGDAAASFSFSIGGTAEAAMSLPIEDISAEMPTNLALPAFSTRQTSAIRQLVIHHTGTAAQITPWQLANFLVQRQDQAGMPYHYCITAAGQIYQTQAPAVETAHAGRHSAESLGIALIGNFDRTVPPAAQLEALIDLLVYLGESLSLGLDAQHIRGLGELSSTSSPGRTWPQWRQTVIDQAATRLLNQQAAAAAVDMVPDSDFPAFSFSTTATTPATAPSDKLIEHYVLFWHHGQDDWARDDFLAAMPFVARFAPTLGFSVAEAKQAQMVTIVGGALGVPASVEAELVAAGCEVERLDGKTQAETSRMFNQLVFLNRRMGVPQPATQPTVKTRQFSLPLREPLETDYYRFKKPYVSPHPAAGKPHPGVDYHQADGAPVAAVADGRVVLNKYNVGGYGQYLVLSHELTNGEKVYSLYAHLQRGSTAAFTVGRVVRQGVVIGREGKTETGLVHLHFEIKKTAELGIYSKMTFANIDDFCYDPDTFLNNPRYQYKPL